MKKISEINNMIHILSKHLLARTLVLIRFLSTQLTNGQILLVKIHVCLIKMILYKLCCCLLIFIYVYLHYREEVHDFL